MTAIVGRQDCISKTNYASAINIIQTRTRHYAQTARQPTIYVAFISIFILRFAAAGAPFHHVCTRISTNFLSRHIWIDGGSTAVLAV
jgi:hypothetical protein